MFACFFLPIPLAKKKRHSENSIDNQHKIIQTHMYRIRSSRISLLKNGQIMIFLFALNHVAGRTEADDDDHFVIIIESRFSFYDVLIQFQEKYLIQNMLLCIALFPPSKMIQSEREMCEMNEPRFENKIVLKRDRERRSCLKHKKSAHGRQQGREVEE